MDVIIGIFFGSLVLYAVFSGMLFFVSEKKNRYSRNFVLICFSVVFSLLFWLSIENAHQSEQENANKFRQELIEEHNGKIEEAINKAHDEAIEATIYELNEKLRDDCFELIYQKRQPTKIEKTLCEESIFFLPNIESEIKQKL